MERAQFLRNGVSRKVLAPFPLPLPLPSGFTTVTPLELLAGYRTLMQHMGGRSRAVVAAAEEVSEPAVTNRIKRFRKRLPASWSLVFPIRSARNANAVRQELYPLPRPESDAVASRAAAASRMAGFGVDPGVITQITGIEHVSVESDRQLDRQARD